MDRSHSSAEFAVIAAGLIGAIPLPVVVIGSDEKIIAINDLALPLFGRDSLGRHYITALRQPSILDAIEATQTDSTTRQTGYLGRSGGRDTTFRATVATMHVPPHKSVVVSFEDVTAIEEAGQMRRDFVANVSHELRTPLTALLGFVETLRGAARNDPAARDRFLQIMEREAGRMARLVEDLLSLSRVEDNERLRPTDPVDLSALVNATTTLLAPVAATAGVVLQTDLPAGPVVVPGDAGQLRQVLNNLIENAIKYGISGGRVLVSVAVAAPDAALRANGVRLTVQDWGEGIAAHHIPRLTERFYRIDTHRSREIGGTGLGLAIVKHIVNRHRGRLRIDSAPGKGTVLTLILPTG